MTAEAPSAVSAEEPPQSVVDGGSDGAHTPDAFSYLSNGNGHVNGSAPNGTGPVEDAAERGPVEDESDAAEPEVANPADAIEAHVAEPETTEPEPGDRAPEAQVAEPQPVAPDAADSDPTASDLVAPDLAAPDLAAPDLAGSDLAGSDLTGSDLTGSDLTGSDAAVADDVAIEGDAVVEEPVEVVDGVIDDAPAPVVPMSTEDVAAEVAEQLGLVVGEDVQADPAEFAAAAVLDVLRASGWADATEAGELRAEANRLRELLAEVIRDHRAREASTLGVENQQLHWLVPLLRAAHGVAFGSLGAKVALRTAVQEVPPEVLASAGLRIDYGVEPAYEDDRER